MSEEAGAHIDEELRELLHELARLQQVDLGELSEDHQRWALYDLAIREGVGRDLLFRLLPLEPDLPMASSVVVQLVERVDPEERAAWVGRIPPEQRDYALRRVGELEIVDAVAAGELPAGQVAQRLDGWSDWVQRRITECVRDPAVLEIMAERGRTRRVRGQAGEERRRLRR
ncbi:hypothetical protein HII36_44525 [Nonomuraea sp. NN258]|uniref:hypothetical protein n=1 Tax=Nonomuraea antri TaxID=2730852 RepID=UPI001569724A|nr:hypothetical protein [Nonomuraea antri]NRQ38842.1 hypothetical protein [Nonomuraea antri]